MGELLSVLLSCACTGPFLLWQVGVACMYSATCFICIQYNMYRACHSFSCVPPHSTPSSSLHSVTRILLHLVPYSSPAGLSGSLVVLMTVGMITSIALFPIGIVLLIVTCCCCHGKKSSDECYDSSYHNPTSKCDRHSYRLNMYVRVCTTLYTHT